MDSELDSALLLLKSTAKKKDRRDGIQKLAILLDTVRVENLIGSNTCRKTGVTWTTVFSSVHLAVYYELNAGTVNGKFQLEMNDLIGKVVEKARGSIKTGTLAEAVIEVLTSNNMAFNMLGWRYYEIAANHLLERPNRRELYPQHWNKLAEVCIKGFQSPPNGEKKKKEKFLDLLWKTVKLGVDALDIPKLLPFLQEALCSATVPSTQHLLLLVVNACLEAAAADHRFLVAEFVEAVIPSILQFYGAGRDYNFLIFQFFTIALNVHHPKGADDGSGMSHAADWVTWKEELDEILKVCRLEAVRVCRTGHDTPLPQYFMPLIVDLSYILRNKKENPVEDMTREVVNSPLTICSRRKRTSVEAFGTTQTQKRARSVCLPAPLGSLLSEMDSSDRWFWLTYLDFFIDRHPAAVYAEYSDIVLSVTDLLCEVRRPDVFSPLARCASKLLSCFAEIVTSHETRKMLILAWEKSLESFCRSAGNEKLQDQFHVIEMMAKNLRINLTPILDVFLNDNIAVSPQNLKALIQIVNAGGVKTESDRCTLCRWAIENLMHPEASAMLVIALASKQYTCPSSTPVRLHYSDYQDMYYLIALNDVPSVDATDPNKPQHVPPSLYAKVMNCLLEKMQKHSDSLLEKLAAGIDDKSLEECFIFLKFALLVESEFWGSASSDLKVTIRIFSKVTSAIAWSIQSGCLVSLEGMAHLYALDLHSNLHDVLRTPNWTDPEMPQALLAFIQRNWFLKNQQEFRSVSSPKPSLWLKYSSPFDKLQQTRKGQSESDVFGRDKNRGPQAVYLSQAVDALTQYLIVPGSKSPSTNLVNDLIEFLSDEEECKYSSPLQLQLVVRILHSLCCSQLDREQLAKCIEIVYNIISDNHSDITLHTALLAILVDRLPENMRKLNQNAVDNLRLLMLGFQRVLKSRDLTPLDMILSYLRLVTVIFNSAAEDILEGEIVEDITSYIWHKCGEVRAAAVKAITAVIGAKPNDAQWHRSVMQLVENKLTSVSELTLYEKIAFTGTSLIALANFFAASQPRRLPIANFILKFVKDSNCNIFVTENLLKYCSSLLRVEDSSKYFAMHLKDLVVGWLQDGRGLSEFPYGLLRCASLQQFYKNYLHIITAVCFFMSKTNVLKEVASVVKVTLAESFERGFPLIKARALPADLKKILQYFSVEKPSEIFEQRLDEFIYFEIRETDRPSRESLQMAFERISVIQKLLLLLEEDIVESVTEEDRHLALSRYKLLVEKYFTCGTSENAEPLSQGFRGGDCNTYVFRDAVSVVLKVLAVGSTRTHRITAMCCNLLQNVVDASLTIESLTCEMSFVLPEIVNTLVSISSGDQENSDPVLRLLRYLIVDCQNVLCDAIALLDPLPDEAQFSNLHVPSYLNLRQELKRTVSGYKGRRVAGLTRLLKALETQKEELIEMYSEVHSVASGKLLQEAVHELLELCGHRDQAVRIEAAKCLGELGPADLGLLVTRSKNVIEKGSAIGERMVDSVMLHLKNLIETEGLFVKKAACAALYAAVKYRSLESQCSTFYAPFLHVSLETMNPDAKTDIAPPNSIWAPGNEISHDVWVTNLTKSLLNLLGDNIGLIDLLVTLCSLHPPTAQFLLPYVLEMTLTVGCEALQRNVVQSINHLLQLQLDDKSGLTIKSALCLVDAVDYIRCHAFRNNIFNCLAELNKLNFAEVASSCGAHFISMMFCELWFEDQKNAAYQQTPSFWRYSVDDLEDGGARLSRIMRSAFVNVGVLDGLQGCGSSHLTDPTQILAHMEQIGRWDVALVGHDVTANHTGIVHSLRNNGLLSAISNLPGTDQDTKLACAAQLGDWSQVLSAESTPSFHLHHYSALKSLHELDSSSALDEVENATSLVLQNFSSGQGGNAITLYHYLSHLQCLKQLRDIIEAKSEVAVAALAEKWTYQDQLEPNNFSMLEEILTTRCVAISQVAQLHSDLGWNEVVARLHLRLCEQARKANRHDVALRNSHKLRRMSGHVLLNCAKVEEAQYFWALGEQKTATSLLNKVIMELPDGNVALKAKCLRIYGTWMAETKAENSNKICSFFRDSMNLHPSEENFIESCAALAKFADSLFIQLKNYKESAEFSIRVEAIKARQSVYKAYIKDNRKPSIAVEVDKREADIDEMEINTFEMDVRAYLVCAVRHYALTLQAGNKFDHFMFRLVSMWLNCPQWGRDSIVDILETQLPNIPSYKFITLLPQIAPRMHENQLLKATVERCLKEHPHHTLPIVMAISKAHEDALPDKLPETTERMRHADNLLRKVAVIPALAPLVHDMEVFFTAAIDMANHQNTAPDNTFPEAILGQLKNLSHALMPTVTLAPQPNMIYSNIIGVSHISPNYALVGGVNKPKRVVIYGTDGLKRFLLVKGNDDPRQDAMMQQVFQVVNGVLARDEVAAREHLHMRTYRVMPLTQRSGVIQWCPDTQPLGLYLVGPRGHTGAHVRFRKDDLNPYAARQLVVEVQNEGANKKLTRFLQICEKFKPVFNYFFLENFPSAESAFEKRLAFTKSVATSSMIGYVMGLGDRHVQNILIDNLSGEVIHIDFGIAFEMGRTLKTPETIPFRLTRDIVDGMGICGVDGVFRASCQRTMTVLRDNKDVLITLLEVLLYDPLNSWGNQNNKPVDSSSSSESSEPSTNPRATRILQRVTMKLQGTEDGGLATVEGQINGLFQKAQDPANLSKLFHGWQAYL